MQHLHQNLLALQSLIIWPTDSWLIQAPVKPVAAVILCRQDQAYLEDAPS